MKQWILVFLLLNSICGIGQKLPQIELNTNAEERSKSEIFQAFNDQYDFLMVYSEESYWWRNERDYNILATNNGKWYFLRSTSKQKKDGSFTKPVVTERPLQGKRVNALLDSLSQIGFWTLDQDSLNYTTKQDDRGGSMTYTISDGVNYKFTILTKEGVKHISAYAPDYFLQELPECRQREKFIRARDLYKKTLMRK